MTTLEKVEKLIDYLKYHHLETEPVIDSVLDKWFDRERQELIQQRDRLRSELKGFEKQYQLASSEFFRKFSQGEMGDEMDFVDWAGAWRVYQTVLKSLAFLEHEPKAA